MKYILNCINLVLLLVSCGSENIVENAAIEFVKPERRLTMETDSTFDAKFPQTLDCALIGVANDSVIVLYDMAASAGEGCFYKAYSSEDYSYIGEFLRAGRGPGEVLYPEISGTYRSAEDSKTKFFLWDLMLGHSYSLDPYDAMNDKAYVVDKISDLPAGTLSVLPYKDSLQFVINIDNDDILFNVINYDGEKRRTFRLYPDDISAEQYLSAFSNCISVNSEECMAALAMVALPQINFLNMEDGSVKSVAVDRKYKAWRNILKSASDVSAIMKSTQYYYDTESTGNYFLALYLNRTVETFAKHIPGHSPHIHIFDWEGNFLYDIQINENITSIAYDSRRKFMYGLDRNEGRIYRYDMDGLL